MKQKQQQESKTNTNEQNPYLAPPSFPSLQGLFIHLSGMGAAACRAVYTLVHTALPANVQCVIWCWSGPRPLASGSISPGPSLKLFSAFLLLFRVLGIQRLWFHRTCL